MAIPYESRESARLEIRVSRAQKEQIEEAAALTGQAVSGFIVAHVEVAAKNVFEECRRLRHESVQSQTLAAALLSNARPNKKLWLAMKNHRKLVERR